MNKYALQIAAVFAAMPLALSGCSSSSEGSPTTSPSSGADDRGAVNNSSGSAERVIGIWNQPIPTSSSTPAPSPSKSKSSSDDSDCDSSDDSDCEDDGDSAADSADDVNSADIGDVAEDFDDIAADEIGDIAGGISFYPVSAIYDSCNSSPSINPVLVTNTTDSQQTYSVTYDGALARELAFFSSISSVSAPANGCPNYTGNAVTNLQVTVDAGETAVAGVVAGNGDRNAVGSTYQMAIGAGGKAWYDFYLHLNGQDYFDNLELNYSDTGGTDPSTNVQSGLFNVMECATVTKNNNTYYAVTDEIVSGYTKDNPNRWAYTSDEPICFAFLDSSSPAPSSWPTAGS